MATTALISVQQAAAQLGVDGKTVRRWLTEGHLTGSRLTKRTWRNQCVAIATMVDHELKQSPERVDRLPARIEEALVSLVCRALDAAGRGA